MTPAEAARNPVYGVLERPLGRRRGRAVRRRAGRASRTCSRSTWAARRPTSRCARRASRRSGARRRSGSSASRSRASTCTPSAPAAARSRTCPSSPARCASARSRRAPSPAPRPTARAATEPTVTDANVVLGHLPADLIGGEMALDVEAARAAVQKVADAMGLEPRGGRRRHPADRQREHGGRAARDQRAARPRPARVRAGRLRRRRPAARQRGRRADGLVPGDRAAVARACCARWATSWPASATSSRRR